MFVYRYEKGLNIMKGKQLGRSIYIPVGPIKIPAGIFLEISGDASAELSVSWRCNLLTFLV